MSTQTITDEPVSCCRCRVRVQDLVPTTDDIVSGCRSEQATALMPVLILASSSRARPQRLRAGPSAVEPGRKQIPSHASIRLSPNSSTEQHRAAQPCTYFCPGSSLCLDSERVAVWKHLEIPSSTPARIAKKKTTKKIRTQSSTTLCCCCCFFFSTSLFLDQNL